MLWLARAGAPWRDLPDELGKWNSVFQRFRRWAKNLVERFFNKIKHFRRIATRYEKTVVSLAPMLFLVGAVIWLR